MNKFLQFLITIVLAIIIGLAIVWAGVVTKTFFNKTHKFDCPAGYRILVIDTRIATKVYTRILPTEARVFDYKVPEGKKVSGVLIEK